MKIVRKKYFIIFAIIICIAYPLFSDLINALEEGGVLSTEQEMQAQKIFRELKCLACDGQSVLDSNADFAKSIRAVVRNKIRDGYNEEKILDFLQENYGDGIFFDPPININTFLLWIFPFIMVIGGFAVFVVYLKKNRI
ncbi:MAG: cytochrome c-type biogenesis protein [Rickettsiales bacterium]|nr:cytochrome c-type biogenesis protein [Rickettsiales bacterium]